MAEIKARIPKELTDENYDEWFTRWVAWFLAFPDDVAHANWLRPKLHDMDNDYHEKRIIVLEAEDNQESASNAWRTAVKKLREQLIRLRISLPTLTPGDDSVLDLLKLRDEVPEDADKVIDYTELVLDAWKPVSGDPKYAPFAPRLNQLMPMRDDVNAKRIVMGKAILDHSTAADNKTAARDVCNTRERAVFNFFRGENMPDTFWTSSPYGLPSAGDEKKFPAPGMLMYDQFRNEFSWQAVPEATGYELEITEKQSQEKITIETDKNQKRQELASGDYETKVRAVKTASDKVYSKWSGDVLFTVKPAPDKFKYNPGQKELSWDSVAGATMYEVRKDGSFAPIYLGPDTKCVLALDPGQYKFRVRGGDEMANWWSEWSETLLVDL